MNHIKTVEQIMKEIKTYTGKHSMNHIKTVEQIIKEIEIHTGKVNWFRVTNPACTDKTFEEWAALQLLRVHFPTPPRICAIDGKTA
jgi:hypothetical protein